MTTTYLKAADESAMFAALESAGIVTSDLMPAEGVFLDLIGTISLPTGELDAEGNPIYAPIPGYHANIYTPITDEQRAMLPWIEAPGNPVRVRA